mgnify:CR=1 FL=1
MIWILTKEVNDYDQYGQYFVSAFNSKPTFHQLFDLGLSKEQAKHLLETGGGRIEWENEWYFLKEVEPGKSYDEN